jgi:hypothetical protein
MPGVAPRSGAGDARSFQGISYGSWIRIRVKILACEHLGLAACFCTAIKLAQISLKISAGALSFESQSSRARGTFVCWRSEDHPLIMRSIPATRQHFDIFAKVPHAIMQD